MTTPPAPAEILRSWEYAADRPQPARALALLCLSRPGERADDLALLSPGRRDAALLDLRMRLFGHRVVAVARCGACGANLELAFSLADVRVSEGEAAGDGVVAPEEPLPEGEELEADGYLLRFRLPDSRDLMAALCPSDPAATRTHLLRRCVLAAHRGQRAVPPGALPAAVVERLEARMAELDPQADVRLSFVCPDCGAVTEQMFDIAAHLWSEVHAWARRTLWDVHLLASSYAWSEQDVLAMSPARRRFYLEAVTS
ncbi:hypothetical protein [Streptomyces sp. ODS28]|uniref:T4 family baseplate hub assembly chaperone n=1 Tax=Streptomyces sp. ODS28 TaxID=3136688 RepID=UPI0031E817F9